jgi:hypothetical protein
MSQLGLWRMHLEAVLRMGLNLLVHLLQLIPHRRVLDFGVVTKRVISVLYFLADCRLRRLSRFISVRKYAFLQALLREVVAVLHCTLNHPALRFILKIDLVWFLIRQGPRKSSLTQRNRLGGILQLADERRTHSSARPLLVALVILHHRTLLLEVLASASTVL